MTAMELQGIQRTITNVRSQCVRADSANDEGVATPGLGTMIAAIGQLAATVEAIAAAAYDADHSAKRANDTASMLANGIQPD